jgi:putative ABC transport system substrate-binding protein
VSLGLLAGCGRLPWQAQAPAPVPRIGYLSARGALDPQEYGFLQGLRERGYVEGNNIIIEWRFADGNDQLRDFAAELVRLQPDVLVAAGSAAVSAAQQSTSEIPIVMPISGDPVRQGYVTSLGRPEGNITGLTSLSSSAISGKRIQLITEVVPGAHRVAILWNPDNSAKLLDFKETEVAARALGVQLDAWEVRSRDDFESIFAAITRQRPDAVVLLSDALTFTYRAQIMDFTIQNKLPSIYELREFAEAGGLMAYGPNVSDLYRRAATYVEKILKGAKPADLPIEQPMRFDFVVNMKTAQALGITFPNEIMLQVTEVIE